MILGGKKYLRAESKLINMAVKKLSISVSLETYEAVEEAVEAGDFRSVSHLFEDGAKALLRKRLAEKSENPCEAFA